VRALIEQVQVEVGEHLTELIRVNKVPRAVALPDAKVVREIACVGAVERYCRLEQPLHPLPLHCDRAMRGDELDSRRCRLHGPDDQRGTTVERRLVATEHGERVVAGPAGNRVEQFILFRT
jgi:hypothetical protein